VSWFTRHQAIPGVADGGPPCPHEPVPDTEEAQQVELHWPRVSVGVASAHDDGDDDGDDEQGVSLRHCRLPALLWLWYLIRSSMLLVFRSLIVFT